MCGSSMDSISRCLIAFLLAAHLLSEALAQDRQPDQTATRPETAMPANGPLLTGKERTGRKWMDEQRIDNCNVPADKRGSKPRPDCPRSPSG
jgi:hypothetical protein